jgi:HK97 family phage major capsid protein
MIDTGVCWQAFAQISRASNSLFAGFPRIGKMITREDCLYDSPGDSGLFIRMPQKDVQRYSLRRVLDAVLRGNQLNDGLEAECHQEVKHCRSKEGIKLEGFGVPFDVFMPRLTRAAGDMQVGVFGQGGAFVATEVSPEPIPLLRNRIACVRMGATVLSGLSSFFALPRQTSPSTVQSLPETGAVAQSNPTLDQLMLVPHRASVDVAYSKQLLLQSSVAIENWLRDDLFAQIAIKLDSLMLNGKGAADEPTGLFNTVGLGVNNFSGTATWQKILAFEKILAAANADVPGARIGWITTPNVRNAWKGIAKTGTGVATTVPIFLWDADQDYGDTTNDGRVNGYRAAVTNQVPNDWVAFGNWVDLVLAIYGSGLDLLSNPYLRAKEAVVEITATIFADVAVRHPESFIVSGDSGAE